MEKDDIMLMEYMDNYGRCDFEMVAIYNRKHISEAGVKEAIQSPNEHAMVIKIRKDQYENIFGRL